jgi:hypothetical protein
MAQAHNTLGSTIGRALGTSAAYAVHGAVSAAQYTGRFGQDVASGATEQYAAKSAELSARREQLAEQRAAAISAAVEAAAPPVAKQRRLAMTK